MKKKIQIKRFQELWEIIKGIKEGRLEHKQSTYHCGSAHCIAGWLEVNELKRRGLSTYFDENGNWHLDGKIEELWNYGIDCFWVERYLGLENDENIWSLLFEDNLTIEEIEKNFWYLVEELELDKTAFN